jgi:hypothetical protein
MASLPDYQYSKLLNDDDIRLITLFPAERFDDPLRVSIEHHRFVASSRVLDGSPDYWDTKHDMELARDDIK